MNDAIKFHVKKLFKHKWQIQNVDKMSVKNGVTFIITTTQW